MSEARPHLVAVDSEGSAPPAPAAPAGGGRATLWLVAGLAVICAIGWLSSARNGQALAEELQVTQAGLEAAQARVGALEGQLQQVQERTGGLVDDMANVMGQLGALTGDLEALGALAGSDPEAAPVTESAPQRPETLPAE